MAWAAAAAPAWAQPLIDKPLKLVLPVPAGGPMDVIGRLCAEEVAKLLGQPVVVDNKAGGSGAIAASYIMKQPADGTTLMMSVDATFALMPLVRKMPYRPFDDFSFIGSLAFAPQVVAVPASMGVHSMKELVAAARAKPGKLNYGAMLGAPQHLDMERFKRATGTDVVMVPYNGGAPIVSALLADQIQLALMNYSLFSEWVRQGKVRLLATTAHQRLPQMPELPTMAEAGFPDLGMDEGTNYVLAAPPGMSADLRAKLYQVFSQALSKPEVRRRMQDLGADVQLRNGDALKADLVQQYHANEKLVKALDIRLTD
jgi:tripartite-type tricarboxylate transporter receptor subunit TctC